jgi:hypothetical protein
MAETPLLAPFTGASASDETRRAFRLDGKEVWVRPEDIRMDDDEPTDEPHTSDFGEIVRVRSRRYFVEGVEPAIPGVGTDAILSGRFFDAANDSTLFRRPS